MAVLIPPIPPYDGSLDFTPIPGDQVNRKLLTNISFTDSGAQQWAATPGLVTDGASIPTFLRFALGKPFAPPQVFAGVVHDEACLSIRTDYDDQDLDWNGAVARRKLADGMFHEACLGAMMTAALAQVFYAGVRIGAAFGAGMPERRPGDDETGDGQEVFAAVKKATKKSRRMKKPSPVISLASAKAAAQQHDLADLLLARQGRRAAVRSMSSTSTTKRALKAAASPVKTPEDLAREAFAKVQVRLKKEPRKTIAAADAQIIAALREME